MKTRHSGSATPLVHLLLLLSITVSFFSYVSLDFEHPPSHTHEAQDDCDCPGDWVPVPGTTSSFFPIKLILLVTVALILPLLSFVPAVITGPAWWDDHLAQPGILLDALPSPALLI